MKYIGTKASSMIAGALTPTAMTTKPRVAARLYAGAVEADPDDDRGDQADRAPLEALVDRGAVDPVPPSEPVGAPAPPPTCRALMRRLSQPNAIYTRVTRCYDCM